jgi:FHA domain/Domain of unknown function (DUF4388)
MQVILSGSLRHFPPADLLSFLAARRMKGTLDVETAGKRARLFLDDDRIVWAESSRGGDVAETVLEILEWPAGTFTLLDSAVLPDNARPVSLEVSVLVEEAKKRAAAGAVYKDATTFRVVDNPLQQQISLTADDLKLLFRLTSERPFKDLVAELGIPRSELAGKLQHLEQLGLVARLDPQRTDPSLIGRRTLVGSLTPDSAPDNVFPLLDSEQTIGRAPGNSIVVPDGSVSSNHARIVRSPEGFVLEDLQSRNGTFVNGERVEGKRLLADGDLIRLGKIILTFNVAKEGKKSDTTQPEVRVV